ncbi:hypothetical protein R6Q59_033443 [Mikania micrantha]|uniref:HMA domain-containing protein n=1 Tax=Mikania micrantha TaxID=192012 RepID=A0A5N6NTV0_9ASTR|nr:hypothetical protein E3N88_18097 [Mikania micrantha]
MEKVQICFSDSNSSSFCVYLNHFISICPILQQKIVVKVSMNTDKKTRKALKIAVSINGVESASFVGPDKDQIAVTGAGIDSVELTTLLRKKVGYTELLSVGPVEQKKPEADKPKPADPTLVPFPLYDYGYGYGYSTPGYYYVY